MDYQIIWSEEAQDEIHAILNYLLDEWGDSVADRFSNQMVQVGSILEKHPFAGQGDERISAVREMPVKPYYMIHYTVINPLKIIYILNVIDSRRK